MRDKFRTYIKRYRIRWGVSALASILLQKYDIFVRYRFSSLFFWLFGYGSIFLTRKVVAFLARKKDCGAGGVTVLEMESFQFKALIISKHLSVQSIYRFNAKNDGRTDVVRIYFTMTLVASSPTVTT